MKNVTIEEATREWINEWNMIPNGLIEKAYGGEHIDEFYELTKPVVGDYVWSNDLQDMFKITQINNNTVTLDYNGENYDCDIDEVYLEHDSWLPMWGWLWNPAHLDEEWVRENLELVSQCGFRIFESDDVGILLGIDGCGYSFIHQHFIPLYKARGLHWHNVKDEQELVAAE